MILVQMKNKDLTDFTIQFLLQNTKRHIYIRTVAPFSTIRIISFHRTFVKTVIPGRLFLTANFREISNFQVAAFMGDKCLTCL